MATESTHEAEPALKAGDLGGAYGPSAVAHHIARPPFLPGEMRRWFEERRATLASLLLRALECRGEVYLWNREYQLAVEVAREAVALRPFRETAYRLLMRSHAAAGNAGEALWVYEQCRTLMSEELGGLHLARRSCCISGCCSRQRDELCELRLIANGPMPCSWISVTPVAPPKCGIFPGM